MFSISINPCEWNSIYFKGFWFETWFVYKHWCVSVCMFLHWAQQQHRETPSCGHEAKSQALWTPIYRNVLWWPQIEAQALSTQNHRDAPGGYNQQHTYQKYKIMETPPCGTLYQHNSDVLQTLLAQASTYSLPRLMWLLSAKLCLI